MTRILFTLALAISLAACSSVQVTDYSEEQPVFIPEEFFDGRLTAHGLLKTRGGKVTRRFNAEIKAHGEDGVGTLEEDLVCSDGELQRRVWTLTPNGDGRYIGTAGDVVGPGDLQVSGNSLFLDYVLRIPYGDGEIDLRVDDRMYLVTEDILINESVMTKFGVEVGYLLLTIIRHPEA